MIINEPIIIGLLGGLGMAILTGIVMTFQEYEDKTKRLIGLFGGIADSFAVGFLTALLPSFGLNQNVQWLGLGLGLLMTMPTAFVSKTFPALVACGAFGGFVVGWVAGRM
jgi:hypothetical protein